MRGRLVLNSPKILIPRYADIPFLGWQDVHYWDNLSSFNAKVFRYPTCGAICALFLAGLITWLGLRWLFKYKGSVYSSV